jgi:hypothetical protein
LEYLADGTETGTFADRCKELKPGGERMNSEGVTIGFHSRLSIDSEDLVLSDSLAEYTGH